jgi:hypothetical protein
LPLFLWFASHSPCGRSGSSRSVRFALVPFGRCHRLPTACCPHPFSPSVVAAAICHFSAFALVPIGQFFSGCLSACFFVSGRFATLCCVSQLFLNIFNCCLYKFDNTVFISYKSKKKLFPPSRLHGIAAVPQKAKIFIFFIRHLGDSFILIFSN